MHFEDFFENAAEALALKIVHSCHIDLKTSVVMRALMSFQVFDSTGSFLSYINTSADPLYGPQGLALTSDGHVAVADSGNHCFKVYRYLQ